MFSLTTFALKLCDLFAFHNCIAITKLQNETVFNDLQYA